MFRTALAQLYRVSLRSFLALRLRSQHLLRDVVAVPLADARDLQCERPARGVRSRSCRSPSPRPRRPRTRRLAPRVSPLDVSSRFQSISPRAFPKPSSDSGSDCSTSICSPTTRPGGEVVRDVEVSAPDSPKRPDV